jgi:hypothetical protein
MGNGEERKKMLAVCSCKKLLSNFTHFSFLGGKIFKGVSGRDTP